MYIYIYEHTRNKKISKMPRAKVPKLIRKREKQWVFNLAKVNKSIKVKLILNYYKGEQNRRKNCYKLAKAKVLKKLSNQKKYRKHYLANLFGQVILTKFIK